MRKSWRAWMGVAALLTALPVAAQQTLQEAGPNGDPSVYRKFLEPGENHKILGQLAGTWKANLKVLLHGSPPKETTLTDTLETKWILDGRFLETHFSSSIGGEGYKGMTIMGFNGATQTQKFFRLFIADKDVRETYSNGVYIRSKNALVFRGMEHDPVTGDSFEKREVFTLGADKDKFFYEEFYNMADGSDIKVMEGTYTRVTGK